MSFIKKGIVHYFLHYIILTIGYAKMNLVPLYPQIFIAMKINLLLCLFIFFFRCCFAQTGIPVPQMTQCDAQVQQILSNYNIPGATVAISKDGKIVYMRAFGYQDVARTIPTQPYTLFRIASCSKPITSIAIMKLMEQGKIHMNDLVFGTNGIFGANPYFAAVNITDNRIYNITVRNLLEHAAGWNRDLNCFPNPASPYPYTFSGCDPIVAPLYIAAKTDGINPVTKNELIKILLQKGLDFAPGTQYNYSNIGYLILGRVIEQITGMNYEDWVQQNIFNPLGICDIHLAKNLLADKQEREGEYVGNGYTTLSCYNTGQYVPWEYGGFNIEAMDSHGGWIATARDYVRLLVAVDGFSTKPDILTQASLDTMTAPSANNPNYAKGWAVNSYNNWWHTGALDGTASEIVRTSGGYTWVILMNKRDIAVNTNFWSDLDNLGWNCLSTTSTWPTWDLMMCPTTNSAAIQFGNISGTSMDISWTNGNGGQRILVAHKATSINGFPGDGIDYTANNNFGSGTDLGNGNFVVYNGAGSSVSINNLEVGSRYFFRLFDYNKNTITGNNSLYLRCNSTEASIVAGSSLPVRLASFSAWENNNNSVSLKWVSASEVNTNYYELQRSADGINFSKIGKVTAQGQSNLAHNYLYTDATPFVGTTYYRLKMVDLDGAATFSNTVSVQIGKERFSVYPNPANDVLNIQFSQAMSNILEVQILDVRGEIIIRKNPKLSSVQLDISALNKGLYIVKIISISGVSLKSFTKM